MAHLTRHCLERKFELAGNKCCCGRNPSNVLVLHLLKGTEGDAALDEEEKEEEEVENTKDAVGTISFMQRVKKKIESSWVNKNGYFQNR